MAALSSILHMSVYLQPSGSLRLHCEVFRRRVQEHIQQWRYGDQGDRRGGSVR